MSFDARNERARAFHIQTRFGISPVVRKDSLPSLGDSFMPSSTPRLGLGSRLAAEPGLAPYPGWVLGSGQSASAAARIRKILWRSFRNPFVVPWLDDLRLTLYPGNETSRSVFVTGRYEPNEFCLLSKILKPGMTFVDVGANMGLFTLYASRRVGSSGRVLAIEPSQREADLLKRNVQLNGLDNVRILQVALSDRTSAVELLVAPEKNSGHNTLGAFGYNTPLDHRETIQAHRLDDIVQGEGLAQVDVIKMDIEGAELKALRGAAQTLRRDHPLLLLELSDRLLQHQESRSTQVLSLLAERGYRAYGFDSATGLPAQLTARDHFDSENIVAVAGDSLPW
jgi:FkbM family methyltransferase